MKPQIKLTRAERRAEILREALKLAERVGYAKVTRVAIAEKLGYKSSSLIPQHMGSAADLRRDILREAVRTENLSIIAQGLLMRERILRDIPDDLRARAAALVNN